MPAAAARTLTFTPEEYFAWEVEQTERHEYHHGEVFPMPGGTTAHAEVIAALTALLFTALRSTDCTVRSEAMRVQISGDQYVYPDLSATCGEPRFRSASRVTLLNPTLIVEVLSPATRSYDRGEKMDAYRSVASVQEILCVDSARRWAEVARRTDGGWTLAAPVDGGVVRLESVGADLDLDDAYRGIV